MLRLKYRARLSRLTKGRLASPSAARYRTHHSSSSNLLISRCSSSAVPILPKAMTAWSRMSQFGCPRRARTGFKSWGPPNRPKQRRHAMTTRSSQSSRPMICRITGRARGLPVASRQRTKRAASSGDAAQAVGASDCAASSGPASFSMLATLTKDQSDRDPNNGLRVDSAAWGSMRMRDLAAANESSGG